ncbi:MAG: hypothetical protein QHC40_14075 [Sphingobium sp.]|nr:hypothetical protein [Sphingobium sp.]
MAKSNIRITKRVVGELKAGEKERFVWDSELIGFGVRVSPKGLITYVYQYFLEGGRAVSRSARTVRPGLPRQRGRKRPDLPV